MCEFISWYEYKGKLYYLTDEKVFSHEGIKILKNCMDNDLIGHGAIRLFFKKTEGIDVGRGQKHEVTDFWITKNLPPEIAQKIREFDLHWGRMFASGKYFMEDDLSRIIRFATPRWQKKAWDQLLKQNPSESSLYDIIFDATPEFKEKAWNQLLKQNPSNIILRHIVLYATPKWQKEAQAELDKRQQTSFAPV